MEARGSYEHKTMATVRLILLLPVLLACASAMAQGVYLEGGTGGSVNYEKATLVVTDDSGSYTATGEAYGAALEGVWKHAQGTLGFTTTSAGPGVVVYGLGAQVGYVPVHRPDGFGPTLAVNGGLTLLFVTAGGVGEPVSQLLSTSAEFGYALPVGFGVELVPSAVLGAGLPIGADGGRVTAVAGGALGLSFQLDEGLRFVVEPGVARVFDGDQRTFSLSLKMFASR